MMLLLLVFGNISGAAQPPHGGEEPEEKTGTITMNGYCDNPSTNQGGSVNEESV